MATEDLDGTTSGAADGDADASGQIADASSPSSAAARVAAFLGTECNDCSAVEIDRLRAQRRTLNEAKRTVTRELRNETRKRKRMLARSSNLTNDDLVEVLAIRQQRAVAKAKAKAAAEDGR